MTAVRVLGACGLLAAFCSALAGFMGVPFLLGLSGAVMVVGNVYAIVAGRRRGDAPDESSPIGSNRRSTRNEHVEPIPARHQPS